MMIEWWYIVGFWILAGIWAEYRNRQGFQKGQDRMAIAAADLVMKHKAKAIEVDGLLQRQFILMFTTFLVAKKVIEFRDKKVIGLSTIPYEEITFSKIRDAYDEVHEKAKKDLMDRTNV